MAVALYQPIARLIPVILISLFWGTYISLGLIWNVIKQGPKRLFSKKNRTLRPEVLNDPVYGTHHYARMKNIRLHYVAKGPEDRPLVLFLHGFPEFWYSWRYQLKEFGSNYRAVALDMRGYSESDRPQGIHHYHMSKLTDDVRDFIDHLGYKKCTLVAHDWGGAVAWTFAAKYPEYVEKLIICNVPHSVAGQKHLRSSWKQFRMSWYMFLFQNPCLPEIFMGSDDLAWLGSLFKSATDKYPEKFTQEDVEAYKYTFQNYVDLNGPINYYRAVMRFMPERLNNIKVQAPTMIIWGCKDNYLSKETVEPSRKYVENVCDVRYIDDASHWVQQEKPDEVNKFMREFLP